MPTTYALVLRPPRKDGLSPVHLRLITDRRSAFLAVPDVAVTAKHWNENGTLEKHNWIRGTHPYADNLNETLRWLMRAVQQLLHDNPTWSTRPVLTALDGEGTGDFFAFLRKDIRRRAASGHPRTAEKFESIYHKFQSFRLGIVHPRGRGALQRENADTQARRAALVLPFAQLTLALLRDYEQYLMGLGNRDITI